MKKLLAVLVVVAFAHPALAEETLSDERLVDMAAGQETIELKMNVQEPSSKDKTPLFSVAGIKDESSFLWTNLPTTSDYEAKLTKSKRGVIFTHKNSKSRIVLVRTKFTDESSFVWSVLFVPKNAPRSGNVSVVYYTLNNHDNKQLKRFLSSIVP